MSDAPQDIVPIAPPIDYWHGSRQPLTSLAFIAPLLVVYEVGVLLPESGAARNGVDVWLRTLLDWVGLGQYFLLPLLTVCILLGWHYTTRQPWRVSRRVLGRMAVECLVLAVCLRLISELQYGLMQGLITPAAETVAMAVEHADASPSVSERLGDLIMFLGAGIYEELLFRLILLSAAIWGLRRLGIQPRWSVVGAVALTSFLFAAAHYLGPYCENLDLFSFLFRFVAGLFFCVLFVYRGFGITAGAHAGYDILVGLLS
ncbi:MAG: CPBP family intramembrane metalloprotease [Pirellulales bacterium]|nr:CPBP family intramembrane metalloprotease [Pirellulales bacterium]